MDDTAARHRDQVLQQFTRQAVTFSRLPGHEAALELMRQAAGLMDADTILDVACGPGLVACALAPFVQQVVGIDLTPAMIERAQALQQQQGLTNVAWQVGDVAPLPFPDNSFSVVLTRYSFHHFLNPAAVLAEMVRVCKPGGRVMVVDLVLPPDKVAAYDSMEKPRDPAHVHVLTLADLENLMTSVRLNNIEWAGYVFELELEQLLQGSFPNPGDADVVRQRFQDDIGVDRLGIGVHRSGHEIRFAYPIAVVVGSKPA